jgi:hypothetical protein
VAFAAVLDAGQEFRQIFLAHCIMGGTFGLYHLIYAACTWPRTTSGGA